MSYTVETIDVNPTLRVRIEPDEDAENPANWDNVGEITYSKASRYILGTAAIDLNRYYEIERGIKSGDLLGLPVYAYVHGGATISCSSAGQYSDQWDGGHSGWVYCTKEKAIAEWGKKVLTKKVREAALKCLAVEVDTFAQYLRGEVYGYVVERVQRDEDGDEVDAESLDSCWGFYGLDYAIEEGKRAAERQAKEDAAEEVEAGVMAARGVATV